MSGVPDATGASARPPCLLLGADENEALPVLASLHRHGVPITAATPRRLSLGYFSRYPRRRLISPDPNSAPEAFVEWVERQVRGGDFPVTIVCGEAATFLIASTRDRLAPFTRIPLVDQATFMTCRDKALTMKAASRLGVPIPRTWYPEDEGIESVARSIPAWPVVLKPTISNGARGISYPKDETELLREHRATRERYGPCIVQEFIPPGGMQYKAELLMGPASRPLAAGVYDKPRYYPPRGGSSTLNSTVDRPDILEVATRFLTGIGWFGMGDCDFIVDPRDGSARLMEVNPRFTRSIKILVEAGLDFPRMLYQLALGEPVTPSFEYRKGLYLRYFLSDCMWFVRSPERFSARPSFFWLFGRNLRGEIFSWRDPLPTLAYAISNVLRLLDPKQRKFMLRLGGAASAPERAVHS